MEELLLCIAAIWIVLGISIFLKAFRKSKMEMPAELLPNRKTGAGYEVVVEIDDFFALAFDYNLSEEIAKSLSLGKEIYFSACIAVDGIFWGSRAPYVRTFILPDENDFPDFEKAIKSFKGVIGVKKVGINWNMTRHEIVYEELTRKGVARDFNKARKRIDDERAEKKSGYESILKSYVERSKEIYGPFSELRDVEEEIVREYISCFGYSEWDIFIGYYSGKESEKFIDYKVVSGKAESGIEAEKRISNFLRRVIDIPEFAEKTIYYPLTKKIMAYKDGNKLLYALLNYQRKDNNVTYSLFFHIYIKEIV